MFVLNWTSMAAAVLLNALYSLIVTNQLCNESLLNLLGIAMYARNSGRLHEFEHARKGNFVPLG
jgi:hypothetical protein